ncbi:MBL fold metallo-hydrolase [Clostridium felsineum]|uniref:MBL fold metallo-hydrolase n=1 Tax=Clostridium felsineum TaxID=36839 RepID=UPI00214D31A3|nr:MBL fold metallo-hydrolase [Clostridium felsineum]MCR3760691.1 MBL fold metallo-hydrolase [Clostridium felsineum]
MLKITLLGTNGWFDSITGSTPSILIEHNDYYIVLDAGNGISKLKKYTNCDKPVYLFLSHFHIDHISGLHTLLLNNFSKGLYIMLQKGGEQILKNFMNAPFTVPLKKLPFNTEIIEVPNLSYPFPFNVTFLPLSHSSYTLGIRLEIGDKIITYSTDTSYCFNAVKLAKNADLLISECSMKSQETTDASIHLNPELAAKIAKEACATKLILTHFDASRYSSMEERIEAALASNAIFNNTLAGYDGLEIKL